MRRIFENLAIITLFVVAAPVVFILGLWFGVRALYVTMLETVFGERPNPQEAED